MTGYGLEAAINSDAPCHSASAISNLARVLVNTAHLNRLVSLKVLNMRSACRRNTRARRRCYHYGTVTVPVSSRRALGRCRLFARVLQRRVRVHTGAPAWLLRQGRPRRSRGSAAVRSDTKPPDAPTATGCRHRRATLQPDVSLLSAERRGRGTQLLRAGAGEAVIKSQAVGLVVLLAASVSAPWPAATPQSSVAHAKDPLLSWNEGATRTAIVDFVNTRSQRFASSGGVR